MNRKHVWSWALFDLANSVYPALVTATLFSIYFAGTIVGGEEGVGDLVWTIALSTSALIVAASSPLLGSIADRGGARKKFMVFFTLVCVVGVTLFTTLGPGTVFAAFVIFVIANVGFECALVFYNAYLPDIAPIERQGWVSGLGFGLGYLGSLIGLGFALPLALSERIDLVWPLLAGFFLVFSVPAFLFLPRDEPTGTTLGDAARHGLTSFRAIVREVWEIEDLRRYLFAYFFFIDGVLTVIYVAGLVATETFGFAQTDTLVLFAVVQVSALVGAFALAKPTDAWGPKRVLDGVLLLWMGVGLSAFVIQSQTSFYIVAVIAGIGLGSIQSASRAFMASLIPDGKEAEMFGFYALCGKSSSVIGPLLFGAASWLFNGNQRPGFLLLTGLFVLGFVLLQRVRDPRGGGLAPEAAGTA